MTVTRTKQAGLEYIDSAKSVDNLEQKTKEDRIEGHEMILGMALDNREVRNEWIDATERILEEESWERGQMHTARNIDYASVHNEEMFAP